MSHQKLVVDGTLLRVFLAGSECEKEVESLKHLKGVEILPATPEEFLEYYQGRYGDHVEV